MIIKTAAGIDIYCLPDNAVCNETKLSPEQMPKCPICNFDDDGAYCVPELCDCYKEI